jgi:hypothetical protein
MFWPSFRRGRKLLVHYHIFKNAGTSVDQLLSGYFGDAWAAFEGESPVDIVRSQRLSTWLADKPHIRAVSSHLARPPLPVPGSMPVIFLRDPVDRALSVYRYLARDRTQACSDIAATRDFAGFVAWALDSDNGGVVIRDYQVIHLSAASFRYPHIWQSRATNRDFRQARALLRSCPAFGIAREFAASLRLFDRAYGAHFPGLFTGPVHANSTNPDFHSEHEEREHARDALGPALYQRLLDANSRDLALYQWAHSRFRAAVAALDSPRAAPAFGMARLAGF